MGIICDVFVFILPLFYSGTKSVGPDKFFPGNFRVSFLILKIMILVGVV